MDTLMTLRMGDVMFGRLNFRGQRNSISWTGNVKTASDLHCNQISTFNIS
jgi:hypothetical protein